MFFARGFTAIELITVISIFSIIASVSIVNFSAFTANINLQNLAADIALRAKQAQTQALAGAQPRTAAGHPSVGVPRDGVYFSMQNLSRFAYFYDYNHNGFFDETISERFSDPQNKLCGFGSSECLDKVDITTGDKIEKLCINGGITSNDCFLSGNGSLHIVFERPNSDAIMHIDPPTLAGGVPVSSAQIFIISPKGQRKTISVTSLGQISVT